MWGSNGRFVLVSAAPAPRAVASPTRSRSTTLAFGLILIAALQVLVQRQRADIDECVARERRRLAGLLHDGLAQDLALIAAYESRLTEDLGVEHPVTIAARRALSAVRGAIIDLSASDEPTATDALRAVADELARRHGVRIAVDTGQEALAGAAREAVVRIVREAIVNAVRHGGAKNIIVRLQTDGSQLTMTIDDDGCGLGPTGSARPQQGYGLRAMDEWARQLGGQLTTEQGAHGGTAVTVLVS
jgi:signal transduction histidine kinase